ncbi:MAG: hypothetical protein WCF17_14570 [Terracidiphilus sp.]
MHSSISEVPRSVARPKGHLLRILGVGFGIAVIVGNTIGSGILLTPGEIFAHLRSPWFVFAVWAMGGGLLRLDCANGCDRGAAGVRAAG